MHFFNKINVHEFIRLSVFWKLVRREYQQKNSFIFNNEIRKMQFAGLSRNLAFPSERKISVLNPHQMITPRGFIPLQIQLPALRKMCSQVFAWCRIHKALNSILLKILRYFCSFRLVFTFRIFNKYANKTKSIFKWDILAKMWIQPMEWDNPKRYRLFRTVQHWYGRDNSTWQMFTFSSIFWILGIVDK